MTADLQASTFARLEQLNAIGAALSSERDISTLLEKILLAAKDITHADGGTLYLVTENEQALRFEILRNDTLGVALGGTSGNPIGFPNLPYTDEHGAPNNSMVAVYAATHVETVNIEDAYTAQGFDFSGTRLYDENTGYRSRSFLTVPMRNHENVVIGVLQLINALEPASGKVVPFSAADQRLVESLSSQAAIALTNRQLILQLEGLFESFINLINLAIDEKSPYTRGHCERVPILTMMLAEAAHTTTTGPLAGFRMNEADRYELKIAGLLHDCGKITTPVHVVDKATKLHTLYDRIDALDVRFELLKRDAEIELLRSQLAQRDPQLAVAAASPTAPEPQSAAEAEAIETAYAARLAQIEADREFLHRANIGSEAMSPADQQRVRDIASRYRWQNGSAETRDFLDPDEIENLSIRAGTLTAAEREIINHHIVATIRMLEQLPWPRHLRRVPEFAGGHHERMDGKGYPKGLKREEMSIQARIMAIADIFEALTAKDRPYKPGKTLSESLHILGKFRENGHIDPDLFDIFIRQRVYRDYANQYLHPEQIDTVDESRIPGYRV
ncbi:HD domain-containing phosphohydrolase [Sterolibacterium denitrificans]|uniref:HD domain-containing phosphohydrolase n=1 Tax=Sterolibacterium denitrificans TaxID=157592 RepID=UPI001E2C8877|nr:HD domain-containing phosphohydrolase [Sterolibacterium denitrificans]